MRLADAMEHATNLMFAHFDEKAPRNLTPRSNCGINNFSSNIATTTSLYRQGAYAGTSTSAKSDWKKSATCHKCVKKGHIVPTCRIKQPASAREANYYVSGSLYTSLGVKPIASQEIAASQFSSIMDQGSAAYRRISYKHGKLRSTQVRTRE